MWEGMDKKWTGKTYNRPSNALWVPKIQTTAEKYTIGKPEWVCGAFSKYLVGTIVFVKWFDCDRLASIYKLFVSSV